MFGKFKHKGIIGSSAVGILSAAVISITSSSALTPFDISAEEKTSLETKLFIEKNKVKKSEGVNPAENGAKAVVMSKANDKLAIVDNKGKVLDDLEDLHKTMK
ncbi:hypothetical protein AB6A23_22410 [Paenibacillus tarimensis]